MICVGESHMACVLAAADQSGTPLDAIGLKASVGREFEQVREGESTRATRLELIDVDELESKADRMKGPVLSFLGGKNYLALGLKRHPNPFDFVLPEAPELPLQPESTLIPYRAVRGVIAHRAEVQLCIFDQLVEVASGPVYQFETPPPPATEWLQARKPVADPVRQYSGVRYKLWRVHADVVREHVEQNGGRYVPTPPDALDADGLLRPELCANQSHANAAYGALVLEQMVSLQ